MAKTKSWPVVGSIRKGEKGSYIKLNDGYKIVGPEGDVPMNDKRTLRLEKPASKVEGLRDRGIISEADADKRLEKLADMPWLLYDVVAPPPRDT